MVRKGLARIPPYHPHRPPRHSLLTLGLPVWSLTSPPLPLPRALCSLRCRNRVDPRLCAPAAAASESDDAPFGGGAVVCAGSSQGAPLRFSGLGGGERQRVTRWALLVCRAWQNACWALRRGVNSTLGLPLCSRGVPHFGGHHSGAMALNHEVDTLVCMRRGVLLWGLRVATSESTGSLVCMSGG